MMSIYDTEELDVPEHQAIKALAQGDATPYQQKLALQVIVKKFSRTHDLLFKEGSPDGTAFLQGRGFVGTRILKAINTDVKETA